MRGKLQHGGIMHQHAIVGGINNKGIADTFRIALDCIVAYAGTLAEAFRNQLQLVAGVAVRPVNISDDSVPAIYRRCGQFPLQTVIIVA